MIKQVNTVMQKQIPGQKGKYKYCTNVFYCINKEVQCMKNHQVSGQSINDHDITGENSSVQTCQG